MATLGLAIANDIANGLLAFYVRKGALSQTTQDKPLLRTLRAKMDPFPGGNQTVSDPIQGVYMSDTPGALQGYQEDDQLNFGQASNLLRSSYTWKEVHFGLEVSWTEMKKDGLTVTDNNKMSQHKNVETVRIVTSLFQNRLEDWGESWARLTNSMLWADGSQDPKQVAGLKSILTDTPTTGSTGGVARSNIWWRHRTMIAATGNAITASAENQTLTKTLRSEWRQLTRYGGKPRVALCGSQFIDALELEVQDKGIYTQEGFTNAGQTDIGMAKINMKDLGTFEYDPTMDDLGMGKRCFLIDTKRVKLRPMEGEDNKLLVPERPYNYFVFFKSMTFTGVLVGTQLNSSGIYEVN